MKPLLWSKENLCLEGGGCSSLELLPLNSVFTYRSSIIIPGFWRLTLMHLFFSLSVSFLSLYLSPVEFRIYVIISIIWRLTLIYFSVCLFVSLSHSLSLCPSLKENSFRLENLYYHPCYLETYFDVPIFLSVCLFSLSIFLSH